MNALCINYHNIDKLRYQFKNLERLMLLLYNCGDRCTGITNIDASFLNYLLNVQQLEIICDQDPK